MVGRSGKSKAARHRNNMRRKNKYEQDRPQEYNEKVVVDDDDDGCLFMRAFGTAREVINVTRILSGMPSVEIERNARTSLSVEIQRDELNKLLETIEELKPELQQLCLSKSKSMAEKAKNAAENSVPPTPPEEIPSDALIPLRRGKAISSNSLHVIASGRAKSVSNYIRILSDLGKVKSKKQQTLDIEGDNLEELLVCLEKLGSSFKARHRTRSEETHRDRREVPNPSNRRWSCPHQGRGRPGNGGGRPPRCEREHGRYSMELESLVAHMMMMDFLSMLSDRRFW